MAPIERVSPLNAELFEKRPEEELFNIVDDPACLNNLVENAQYEDIRKDLRKELLKQLEMQDDPRVLGTGDIFESYPRYARMRSFTGFKEQGKYNSDYQKSK